MLKKSFILILFLFLSSCGYEAIYSQKNNILYDFSINELNIVGDRDVNIKIKQKLKKFIVNKKSKNFTLNIQTDTTKEVTGKNVSGDPTNFKSTLMVDVEILMNNNFKSTIQIVENFDYKNIENKFDLKKYEKDIKITLAETATDKLISKLSEI
tara:strand:- start:473 stop:934 length:462 start_codon:yes stop_codon:yes gene_type:complete